MRAILIALAFAAGMVSASLAQTWPTHSIRLIVNFPPGGAADLLARLIGQSLSETFGHASCCADDEQDAAGERDGFRPASDRSAARKTAGRSEVPPASNRRCRSSILRSQWQRPRPPPRRSRTAAQWRGSRPRNDFKRHLEKIANGFWSVQ